MTGLPHLRVHPCGPSSKAEPVGGELGRRGSESRLAPWQKATVPPSSRRSSPVVRARTTFPNPSRRWRRRAQAGGAPRDVGERLPRHRDLGHLQHNVAAMAHHTRAGLDELRRASWSTNSARSDDLASSRRQRILRRKAASARARRKRAALAPSRAGQICPSRRTSPDAARKLFAAKGSKARRTWSGREDSNLRPPRPERGALPG